MWMNVPSNSVTLKSQSISNKTLRDTDKDLIVPKAQVQEHVTRQPK